MTYIHRSIMHVMIQRTMTGAVLGALFWLSFAQFPSFVFSLVLLAILIQIILFEWRNFFSMDRPMFWLLMPFYPILPFMLLIMMNHEPHARNLLVVLLILVSSFDTGSYIFGNLFGKHVIAPTISPHKTWEGALGGLFSACVGLTIILMKFKSYQPWWFVVSFAFSICTLSLCGDMFESHLKRHAHIKDSGKILPGHGGFLDRFDGILFAVYFFFIFRNQLIGLFNL